MVSNPALLKKDNITESYSGDDYSSVENSELVSDNSVTMHRLPANSASNINLLLPTANTGIPWHGMAYLGQSLQNRGISGEAKELIISAWRDSTNKSYDSAWRKWEIWCNQKHVNPISAPIESVSSFLASQFHAGHQYQSLNTYRSAISSVHLKIDGFDVGKHPLVSRLMKGVFNRRPPLPKYTTTWSVGTVLRYLRSLSHNSDMTLTHKLATLLALSTVGRSSDLSLLLVNHFSSSSEGIKLVLNGLSKQSRPNHTRPPLLVQRYS